MTKIPTTKEIRCPRPECTGHGSSFVIRRFARWFLAFSALIVISAEVSADAVYLKDGFVLHGKVRHEADLITDPLTGAMIPIVKSGSFFIMDDRVRLVIFNHHNVQNADPDVNIRSDFITLGHPSQSFSHDGRLPKKALVMSTESFDAKWTRTLKLAAYNAEHPNEPDKMTLQQRLLFLSPYAINVQTQRYPWAMCYQTRELDQDTLVKLLDSHAETEEGAAPDVDRRMKRIRFLLQADRLSLSQAELDRATKDLPKDNKDITERLDRVRTELQRAQLRNQWDEIQIAHRAGRYRAVKALLERLPIDKLDDRVAVEAAALKAKYEGWDKQASELTRLLDLVNGKFVGPRRPLVGVAEALIRADAGPDTFDRLEPFLTIADQYEKELKAGKTPTYSRDDVFALAVTGWLMGRESAEPKFAAAERYWLSREFLIAHQRTHDAGGRNRLFDEYQTQSPLSLDEITQMISLSPPTEPAVPGTTVADGVEERQTLVPWTQKKPVTYDLMLPPEYNPTRPSPVLIVLHSTGERPLDALKPWATEAARNGYILAAPDWGATTGYNYTSEEHDVVTELIKDLRRRYAVDSDRVFLAGNAEGGTMAFDVALSHPDLFAGVVPINGRPRKTTVTWYWRNAQYLAFFVVCGEMAANIPNSVSWVNDPTITYVHQRTVILDRYAFDNWMNRGYPSLMVIYKGRATQFYAAEVPSIFDWLNRKRRQSGFPQLGKNPNALSASEEFQSMREGDNHFYWASIEQIVDKYVNHEIGMKIGSPAALEAHVDGNSVFVNSRGIKNLRLWFGRIWDAQTGWRPMIDFTKPLKITVNGRQSGRERVIQPSLKTLLDDLYQRGDRQRLFMAFVDLPNLQ